MTMASKQPPAPPGQPGPPGPLAPSALSALSGDDAKRAWRRLWLIALAVALVMLVGGATSGYLLTRDIKQTAHRATCGNLYCIPTLKASSVIDALKGRGFTCIEGTATRWDCELQAGDTYYRSSLSHRDGLILSYDDSVKTGNAGEASASTKAFLVWFAALPFSNDPVLTEQIDGWLIPRLSGGADTKATIGGYTYRLAATDQQYLSLYVWVGSR
jgi:hypothetical protein